MVASPEHEPPPPFSDNEPPLSKGASLGRYVVLDPLGQGAMGIVYRAFDPELDRRIAVKLLRRLPDFASGEEERLLREGKAMARLSHPNVVTVYDVGTYGERVFVAMELVEGETLRSWLRSRRSWREVVGMFVQAARGLAAAHAAGLVHRDFKPDNVLVGADGRVRVVDFGLAWTPENPPADKGDGSYHGPFSTGSSYRGSTNFGSMVGTPRYSAPEQLEGKRVDPSADQFAFCASLWEALYGAPPFTGSDLLTLISNVRLGDLPRKPPRPGAPRRLFDALRRGLSGIPEARFPSMDSLIGELERDPRVVRRRWLVGSAVAAATVAAVVLASRSRGPDARLVCEGGERALAGVWDADRKAAIAQALQASGKPWAGETANRIAGEIDRYGRDWVAMRREACEATSVRHEQSEALLDLRMQCLDERLEEVRSLAGQLSQPDGALLDAATKAVYALTPVRDCADTQALLAPVPPPGDPAVRAEVDQVRALLTKAKAMNDLGRYADAEPVAAELVGRARALHYSPVEAETLEVWADALESLAQYPRAVDTYREALFAAERGLDRKRAASAMINLLWTVGVDQGHHEAAHEYAAHAAAVLAGLGGDAVLEAELDSHEAAVLRDEGHSDEAVRRSREVVEKRKVAFGTMHPRYAMALNNLGACLADQGRYPESLAASQEALAINAKTLGEHHPDYALSLQSVASDYNLLGHRAEARTLAGRALTVLEEAFGSEHARVASAEWSLALIEMKLDEGAAAERHLRHAVAVAEKLQGAGHNVVAEYTSVLGDLLVREGRFAEAVPLYRHALEIEAADDNGQESAEYRAGLGYALLGIGQRAEALRELETAMQWQEKNHGTKRDLGYARLGVARLLRALGTDRKRAHVLAEQAIEAYAADPGSDEELRAAKDWLRGLDGAATASAAH